MKKIIIGLGSITAAALPVISVISCGSKAKPEPKEISKSYDFSSKAETLKSISNWKKDFFDKELSINDDQKVNVSVALAGGVEFSTELKPSDLAVIQNAGDTLPVADDMSLEDFAANMESITGKMHQYSFPKSIGVGLGVDGTGLLHATTHPDESVQRDFFNELIGTLPSGITMSSFNPNRVSNNIKVTFTDGTDTKEVDFHLKEVKDQATADEENSKKPSKFYTMVQKVTSTFKKTISEVKELGKFMAKNPNQTMGDFIAGVASAISDGLVETGASFVPGLGELIHIPILGGKIMDFINNHITNPIVSKLTHSVVK